MIEFRSVADLNRLVLKNLHRLPTNLDLIVGIPRSGMLPALLVSLYLNLPLADLDGFIVGRSLCGGRRAQWVLDALAAKRRLRVLVMDDSYLSGNEMNRARKALAPLIEKHTIFYGVAYIVSNKINAVDFYMEIVDQRIFEWNYFHNTNLKQCCVDIDGVLCRDPTESENDDGKNYIRFLREVSPFSVPEYEIGWLVTSRLEKYRQSTEQWLDKHGFKYRNLVMLDLPSKEERIRQNSHALFKASVYNKTDAILFIESDPGQAQQIAEITRRPVLCNRAGKMYYGMETEKIKQCNQRRRKYRKYGRNLPESIKKPIRNILLKLKVI